MDMTRRTLLLAIGVVAMSAGAAEAHDGHKHTVMGTVMAVNAKVVEVKTPSGEILSIAINQKTTAIRQKKKIALAEVQVGRRVVVDIGNGEDPLIAKEIELGAPAPAAKK